MLFLPFTFRGCYRRVLLDEINYIKSEGRKIFIHAAGDVFEFYGSMKAVMPWLDGRFYRSHGGLIVNLSNIDRFVEKKVIFFNGDEVNIGIHNLRLTRNRYKCHMEETALYVINGHNQGLKVAEKPTKFNPRNPSDD